MLAIFLVEQRVKWGVAKETEFDNENDGNYDEEENEANQAGAECYH